MIISQGTVPLLKKKKRIEQFQQMLHLGHQQTITPPMSNVQDKFSRIGSEENRRVNPLNF